MSPSLEDVAGDLLEYKPFFEDYKKISRDELPNKIKITIDGLTITKGGVNKDGTPGIDGTFIAYTVVSSQASLNDPDNEMGGGIESGGKYKTWFGSVQIRALAAHLLSRDVQFPLTHCMIKRETSRTTGKSVYFLDTVKRTTQQTLDADIPEMDKLGL